MSWACPTSSCTFAVSASLRCSVGALRIHSRSGRTPISSELPCISMNLISFDRYSSGIQSSTSTWPPDWTYSRNPCSVMKAPPTERSLGAHRSRAERGLDQRPGAPFERIQRPLARDPRDVGHHDDGVDPEQERQRGRELRVRLPVELVAHRGEHVLDP